MGLKLADRWVWDFWTTTRDDEHHVFYLQAPRTLGNPDLRHRNASVGHAVSTDLTNWTVLPDALRPSDRGAWDDVAIWTGSIIEHERRWFMLYTGTSHAEEGRIQRVGLATSDDLMSWERYGDEALIEADDRWYERLGTSDWPEEAWRDPWVTRLDDGFHVFLTARANEGPTDGRGVIGHAVSNDLISWQVGPPLSGPGDFGHLEVPQVVSVDDGYVLVFSCQADRVSERRQAALATEPRDAVYVVRAPEPTGPFAVDTAEEGLPKGLYSGRLVGALDKDWVWLAFVDHDQSDTFIGELSDPVPYPWPARHARTSEAPSSTGRSSRFERPPPGSG